MNYNGGCLCGRVQYRIFRDSRTEWEALFALFDLVQTSCGMAVPFFEYTGERDSYVLVGVNRTVEMSNALFPHALPQAPERQENPFHHLKRCVQ